MSAADDRENLTYEAFGTAVRELAQTTARVKAVELTGAWADVRDPGVLGDLNS